MLFGNKAGKGSISATNYSPAGRATKNLLDSHQISLLLKKNKNNNLHLKEKMYRKWLTGKMKITIELTSSSINLENRCGRKCK